MLQEKVLKMTIACQKLINRMVAEHPAATKWYEVQALRQSVQECLQQLDSFKSSISAMIVTAEEMEELLRRNDEDSDREVAG